MYKRRVNEGIYLFPRVIYEYLCYKTLNTASGTFYDYKAVFENFLEKDSYYEIAGFDNEKNLIKSAIEKKDFQTLTKVFEETKGILEEKLINVIEKHFELFIM